MTQCALAYLLTLLPVKGCSIHKGTDNADVAGNAPAHLPQAQQEAGWRGGDRASRRVRRASLGASAGPQ